MSAGDAYPDPGWSGHSRAYWLPLGGTGNGLHAAAWAPIAEVSELLAFVLLGEFVRAGIGAYAAPRGGGRPRSRSECPGTYQVWVDSQRYASAEDTLRMVLTRSVDGR